MLAQKFVAFSAWRAGRISWYSAGESLPIKAGRPEAMPHLSTACKGINTIWEAKEIFSEVWEKSAAVDSAEPNSKGILLHLCQHFVDGRFLSAREFCLRKIFVDPRFLSTRDFFQRESFVDPRFLSTRDFCRRESFVGARFLLTQEFLLYIISFISNSRKGKKMEIFPLLLGDGVVHFDYQHYVN